MKKTLIALAITFAAAQAFAQGHRGIQLVIPVRRVRGAEQGGGRFARRLCDGLGAELFEKGFDAHLWVVPRPQAA